MTVFGALKCDDEVGRLAALRRYEVMDSDPEREFDQIVALVKTVFSVPYVSINLIDSDHQMMMATAGIERSVCRREDAFCNHTIRGHEAMIVENATKDPRFEGNPSVRGKAHIRAYLGVPLTSPEGYNIGALCIFDVKPRKFGASDAEVLRNFAKIVMSQFELRLIARQDSLTGALTRRAFFERLDRAVAQQDGSSLLMLDLDHFKSVNDRYGHAAGDIVLRRVSELLMANLRNLDSVGRLGGEEFGILLQAIPQDPALAIANRLRQAITKIIVSDFPDLHPTVSIGLATLRGDRSHSHWLARADAALYAAKDAGRNRVVVAP